MVDERVRVAIKCLVRVLDRLHREDLRQCHVAPLMFRYRTEISVRRILVTSVGRSRVRADVRTPFVVRVSFVLHVHQPFVERVPVNAVRASNVRLCAASASRVIGLRRHLQARRVRHMIIARTSVVAEVQAMVRDHTVANVVSDEDVTVLRVAPRPFFLNFQVCIPIVVRKVGLKAIVKVCDYRVDGRLQ